MSDGGANAAPGWYPDPYQPSRLRYWDGSQWTDHYHQGGSDGSLPGIGEWLGTTFSAIGAYGIPAAGLAFGASFVLNLITMLMLRWAFGGVFIVDEDFVGSVGGLFARLGLMVVIVIVVQGYVWLAINRFMQRAHLQAEPTIPEALTHALARLPRLIGVTILVTLAAVAVMVVFVIIVAATESGALAVLLVLLLIPLLFWAMVKITFLSAAVVAAPTSTGAIRASASVSAGRFWPVLGRVLLLTIMVGVVSAAASGAFGSLASPIDQGEINDIFFTVGDEIVVRDFEFSDLLPDTGTLIPYLIVSSLLNAATGLVTTSGFMRLYLDSGAPSEV